MANILIKPSNHTGGDNSDFVGMRFASESNQPSVEAIFPLGYHYTSIGEDGKPVDAKAPENQKALRKELFDLLGTIRTHSKSAAGTLEGVTNHLEEFPFDAYVTIVKAFMQYGYYLESEVRYKNAPAGKINWKRTIAQVKPTMQGDSAVYTDFIVRQVEKKTDKLISLIHEWCVYEAFTKIGWIFTAFNPNKPQLNIGEDEQERKYFIYVIQEALKTTFNDRYKVLFKAMIQMLEHSRAEKKSAFFYGTTRFHAVWESLINQAFGIDDIKKKEYFPPAKWHFVSPKQKDRSNKLYPDTIMLHNNDVFVLDAKYYSFIVNCSVPAAADINKQITYGEYAHKKVNSKDKEKETEEKSKVYNAFIIPYDFKRDPYSLCGDIDNYIYIGYASLTDEKGQSQGEESYHKVLGVLVDTCWIMKNREMNMKVELASFIREKRVKAEE